MASSVFGAGLLLGLSIAAPVGPMALLCINRTLMRGLGAGLAIGAAIATGDAIYGAVAAFGFTALTDFLVAFTAPLRLVGGGFLIWLGVRAWLAARGPRVARDADAAQGWLGSYIVAVGLTLTNPATILSFIAAFGALGLAAGAGAPGVLVLGVFSGSALWWLGLCGFAALARRGMTPGVMRWIDRISAMILIGFGTASALGQL